MEKRLFDLRESTADWEWKFLPDIAKETGYSIDAKTTKGKVINEPDPTKKITLKLRVTNKTSSEFLGCTVVENIGIFESKKKDEKI